MKPHRINRMGISRTFQIMKVFPKLTVMDNVRSALVDRKKKSAWQVAFDSMWHSGDSGVMGSEGEEKSSELLNFVGLYEYRHQLAENLPYAYCKRLEIARSLATKPKVLLLDEPSGGSTRAK